MTAIQGVIHHQEEERRRPRLFKPRLTLDDVPVGEEVSRYRLDRPSIVFLNNLLAPQIKMPTERSDAIGTMTQTLITLRYLGKADLYTEVADLHGVSPSSVCRIIERVCNAICHRLDNIIFPIDVAQTKLDFYRKCGLPDVVGAVDGTLVPIIAPVMDQEAYLSRKGYHAINVQAVTDCNMRFVDVVARWPGATHDANIFESCGLKEHLSDNPLGHLLGDSGYGLKEYLMTPIANPTTPAEQAYNKAHCRGRVVVERTFGVLKSRFR